MSLFAELVHFNQLNLDRWVASVAKTVPAGAAVLDIGAGGAPYRGLFAHCNYLTQDFCQLNDDQLVQGKYAPIDYVSDITAIPVEGGSVDVVLSTEVIEHVPEPILALAEMSRVLKPGGMLCLSAPLGSGLHQEPFHFYGGYTPHFYRRFLGALGFDRVEVISKGGSFGHFAQWLVWYFKAANPWVTTMPLLLKLLATPVYAMQLPFVIFQFFYSRFIDRYDDRKQFTGGYYVIAKKAEAAPLSESFNHV
ncbi:MAG: class I SAM-dependent methyltransferase [Ramlibacter sp.]|nr:class I SAM-dependent methyltransferase [Ramlibacter sp.]